MDLYPLDREHFYRLLGMGVMREGDYHWTANDMFDKGSSARVYLRLHASGDRTYWVVHEHDADGVLMRAVDRIPVVTYVWRYR